jgi:hypothetical protein
MKIIKLFAASFLFFVATVCNAQSNANFELWDTMNYGVVPKPWNGMRWASTDTLDLYWLPQLGPIVRDKPDISIATPSNGGVHSGNRAICLQQPYYTVTQTNFSGVAGSTLCLGKYLCNQFKPGTVAFSSKPLAIEGWYKITGNANQDDSACVFLELTNTTTTIGSCKQYYTSATTGTNYQPFNIPIAYFNNNTPTQLSLALSMGSDDQVNVDSTARFFVDDLAFVYATGLRQDLLNDTYTLTPNPTGASVAIGASKQAKGQLRIEVYNCNGALLRTIHNYQATSAIDVLHLANGIYFIKLYDDNVIVYNAKFEKL